MSLLQPNVSTFPEAPGCFITLDGPDGAGKSTIALLLSSLFTAKGLNNSLTAEPTDSPLGAHIRSVVNVVDAVTLAALVALDRHLHIRNVVLPKLTSGEIVISDRYLASSLALQRMDGVDLSTVLALNAEVLRPHRSIIVIASPGSLAQRLSKRGDRTRFDDTVEACSEQLDLYRDTARRLTNLGWDVLVVDTDRKTPTQAAEMIATLLTETRKQA